MSKLMSYEIGSLAKPEWRVKYIANKAITDVEIQDAKDWGIRLNIDNQELINILEQAKLEGIKAENKTLIKQWASRYGLKLLENVGLDLVYDGEQQRTEMYHYAVQHIEGFDFRGLVQSFDYKYYTKAACIAEPKLKKPYHINELNTLKQFADKPLKLPITGAYTLADWSYDEHFTAKIQSIGTDSSKQQHIATRQEFVIDLATNVLRPNINNLIDLGAEWIQIDEPAVTTKPDEIALFVDSFNASVKGLNAKFIIHICFSDYNLLFPHIEKLENCWGLCVGFANYDSLNLGLADDNRIGYHTLKKFAALNKDFHIGVGVLDIHTDKIESVDLIYDRIRYAQDILGEDWVDVCPDCGLRTRSWEIAYQKLNNMREAIAKLA